MTRLKRFVAELRRRKVIHTAIAYAALAWLAIEVVTTVLPVFDARETVIRLLVAVILLGLPIAIVVSWLFDFTLGGFQRDPGDAAAAAASATGAAAGAGGLALEDGAISRPTPAPATPLVGRAAELEAAAGLVREARIVTITGPGGTGKTRLAIAVAEAARQSFPDGLAWIDLAAVSDPNAVVPTMAEALGVQEAETRSLAAGLATVIGDGRVLLVLDNLEQVVAAAPELAGLVSDCPRLHLLCTSRAPLRLRAEAEFPLRPLALPPHGETPPIEELSAYPAIELFLDRTRRARPRFRLTAANAEAILDICRRLDGLPLALELAAARLRTLEPDSLRERLGQALDILTTGARDLPERQRTLRATIDWSHSLLDAPGRRLFRRLAVFSGGWPHAAVEHICSEPDDGNALDTLESLVENGLVLRDDSTGRFGMLETIREYARETLTASGEDEAVRRGHAQYFGELVARLYDDFRGTAQIESMQQADRESANIEEALACFHRAAQTGDAAATVNGLGMCGDLWMYWHVRGRHLRAREWTHRFLALAPADAEPTVRARALIAAAVASLMLGDIETSVAEHDEAEALAAEGDPEVRALIAVSLGVAHLTAEALEPAREWLEEAVRRSRALDGSWELGMALAFLGVLETVSGDPEAARACFQEALALQRPRGDQEGIGLSVSGLAALEAEAGRHEESLALYRDAFVAYRAIGDRPEEARVLDAYAWTALAMDRPDEARQHFAESLRTYEEVGSVRGIGLALLGLAATEAAVGRPGRAVRIAAAAATFAAQEGVASDYARDSSAPVYLDPARSELEPEELARLEAEGQALTVRAAMRYALEPVEPVVPTAVGAAS
jgi:predicted ATPase